MARLVLSTKHTTDTARARNLSPPEPFGGSFCVCSLREMLFIRAPTPGGTRGRATHHLTRHVLDRLRTHQDAFLSNLAVPFDHTRGDGSAQRLPGRFIATTEPPPSLAFVGFSPRSAYRANPSIRPWRQ